MKLSQANFEKPLPFTVSGRRLQSSVRAADRGVERLEVVDGSWILIALQGQPAHLIPMTRVSSVVPVQEQLDAAPAKRRGRPPGSKNRKPDDRPTPPASESVQSD